MLLAVRHSSRFVRLALVTIIALFCALGAAAQAPATQQQSPSTAKPAQQQTSPQPAAQPTAPAPTEQKPATPPATAPKPATTPSSAAPVTTPAPPKPIYTGPMIVLDPAHGGTDTGARGEAAIEKDLVLDFARMARAELESQGFHVVMTRNDDSNPSYADRAAIANAYRNAIFISFHVSSTGTLGTVHTYFYQFGTLPAGPADADNAKLNSAAAHASALVSWEDAQLAHVDASERLANALQAQFAQQFGGSPSLANPAAVRELRSVNAPAVAIEVASISTRDPNSLAALAGPLAVAVMRGLQAFRAAAQAGGH